MKVRIVTMAWVSGIVFTAGLAWLVVKEQELYEFQIRYEPIGECAPLGKILERADFAGVGYRLSFEREDLKSRWPTRGIQYGQKGETRNLGYFFDSLGLDYEVSFRVKDGSILVRDDRD